jgi:hypothetical protein
MDEMSTRTERAVLLVIVLLVVLVLIGAVRV